MKIRGERVRPLGAAVFLGTILLAIAPAAAQSPPAAKPKRPALPGLCYQAVIEGDVKAGQSFERVFAKGFDFYLEALPSGWVVRVLPADGPRGSHDYAELATPPYRSVNPLLISTDFAFRAQDAVAWNPRRFRYAGGVAVERELAGLYDRAMANDGAATGRVAALVAEQPEAELQVLNATLAPGTADQWRMAAAVASHLATTPHQVEQGAAPTPLGRLTDLQFRVRLELPPGMRASTGVQEEKFLCAARPTN